MNSAFRGALWVLLTAAAFAFANGTRAPAQDKPSQDAPAKDTPAKETPAKDAPAKDAGDAPTEMIYPLAVAVAGDVTYVADRKLPGIWAIQDGRRTLYFRGQKRFRTPLNAIRCLAVDRQGRLLAGDSATRNIYRFDEAGKPTALINDGVGLGIPMAIAVDSADDVLVADLETHRIFKLAADGKTPTEVAVTPAPRGLAIDAEDRAWVVSHGPDQVLRIDKQGQVETVVKGRPFRFPHQIALDGEGNAYVVDGYGKSVWKVPADGPPTVLAEKEPFDNPVGIVWAADHLLVADPQANAVLRVTAAGEVTIFESGTGKPRP